MDYLRVFKTPSFSNWCGCKTNLSSLLKTFAVSRRDRGRLTCSVFGYNNRAEELENVAALFQTKPNSVDRRFGIWLTNQDCEEAAIALMRTEGQTGVRSVDQRHFELGGTADNFVDLTMSLVRRIWQGEDRVRAYAALTILGELAMFSRTNEGIHDVVKRNCIDIFERSRGDGAGCRLLEHSVVELTGTVIEDSTITSITVLRQPPRLSLLARWAERMTRVRDSLGG